MASSRARLALVARSPRARSQQTRLQERSFTCLLHVFSMRACSRSCYASHLHCGARGCVFRVRARGLSCVKTVRALRAALRTMRTRSERALICFLSIADAPRPNAARIARSRKCGSRRLAPPWAGPLTGRKPNRHSCVTTASAPSLRPFRRPAWCVCSPGMPPAPPGSTLRTLCVRSGARVSA